MKNEKAQNQVEAVVSGGNYVDPATGYRYWWPDEEAHPATEPLGPGGVSVGFTTDEANTPTCQAKDFSGETWCPREVVAGRDYCWSHLPFPPGRQGDQ